MIGFSLITRGKLGQSSPMMSLEIEGADTLELVIDLLFLLSISQLSDSSSNRCLIEVLNLPAGSSAGPLYDCCCVFVLGCIITCCNDIEEVLLCSKEGLSKVHFGGGEFPLFSEAITHYHVGAVLSGVVK